MPDNAQIDPITKILGIFGKWQLSAMLIVFLCKVPTSWFMAALIFTAPAPNPGDFWCTPPSEVPENYTTQWIAKAQPKQFNSYNNRSFVNYCKVYKDVWEHPMDFIGPNKTDVVSKNLTTIECERFSFNPNYFSLIVEYSLVCDRSFWVPLSQCFHIFGLLVGGIIVYYMLKYISPRNVMIVGVTAQIVFGTTTGILEGIKAHCFMRFLTAASCAFMYTAGSIICADITSGEAKTISILVFEFFWSIGLIVLPIFDLFIESWRNLYIAISMPTICMIFLINYLPDSPRWMFNHGRIDKTVRILTAGGKKNKRHVPANLASILESKYNVSVDKPKEASWREIWDGTPSKIYIAAIHYAWSVYVLNFNCVVLGICMYGRDHLSINTVAIGLSEIIGVFIGIYIVLYTSRRWLWAGGSGIITGLLAYLAWFIPRTMKQTHVVALEMAPTMAIKVATSIGMCVLTVCTVDLVSAERKKILVFSSTVWARACFVWAPFIFMLKNYDYILPLTVFATLSVVGGILMVIIHQNQYKVYLEDCERRLQAMRAVRSISNAGVDWINSVRRNSKHSIEKIRRNTLHELLTRRDSLRKPTADQSETIHELL